MPVIGVEKSNLKGSTNYLEIYRGKSINHTIVKQLGEKLTTNAYELELLSYPSEMNLWEKY